MREACGKSLFFFHLKMITFVYAQTRGYTFSSHFQNVISISAKVEEWEDVTADTWFNFDKFEDSILIQVAKETLEQEFWKYISLSFYEASSNTTANMVVQFGELNMYFYLSECTAAYIPLDFPKVTAE